MDYVTRGVCGQEGCRERRYYLDNGLWFCRRGHLQEGRQVEEDPEDFGTQGKTHRVRKEKEEKSRKTYRGQQAQTLFLQAYQLILWKQCHALVHNHGFPEQFEGVARDLWAMRLQTYSLRINESADDEDQEEREMFSSQPSQTEDSDGMSFKPRARYLEWPRLLDTVALCYMAAMLMRLPVCVSDFHRLIVRQDIPYIRAVRTIPREMRDKLPPEFLSILDIIVSSHLCPGATPPFSGNCIDTLKQLPKVEILHRGFRDLMLFYQQRFQIELPPLNLPLLLYRHIRRLAIPIDVYEIVKTLQGLLGFTFEYPARLADKRRRESLHLPEVQLMVLIIIATKLLFPFDGPRRYPTTAMEPATQAMDWPLWVQAQRHFGYHKHAGGKIGTDMLIQVTDKEVLHMAPEQMDEYLDWYENSWLDSSRMLNPVADMFPISRADRESHPNPEPAEAANGGDEAESAIITMLQTVLQGLVSIPVHPKSEEEEYEDEEEGGEDEGIARPGYWYRRYRWEAALPETARAFYELAADIAGISLQTLIRAVSVAEFRIARWHADKRRAEYFEREMELEADGAGESSSEEIDDMDERLSEMGIQEDVQATTPYLPN
ncbi:uncharacterized protein N7459_002661 [Penicillium hispanicum]|uniref:uncharacterized protein n=1 Tax=Penicillium hispanicum TaxID=1080232 RepID=UPI0025414A59|nr:uncharacterized protein N7459_002661 [Penicillium hispanicum]KAJ5586896.1 hypothetical protein N7459_002661 [Penicillium hispanicum]